MSKTAITGSIIALEVDKHSSVPIYRQIADRLREAIQEGRISPGSKLPSTRVFAEELDVSRNTVLQVFEALTEEGFLSSRVGAGTFVGGIATGGISDIAGRHRIECAGGYPFRSLSRRGKSLVASTTGEFSERPTPFMPDLPDLRAFPIRTWLRLLNETSPRLTGEILADTSNAGYEPLRRAIAQHLNASRGMACDYRQVIITTGSQQSLDLVCRLLLDPGDPVWFEEPGYVGARAVVSANGGSVCPVPIDREGLCVEIAANLQPSPRMVFTSPSRHYPLGSTMSMPRREALLLFARRCGCWIVEDDYDHEFRYAGTTYPAIFGLDSGDRTIHIGTFSKILLPSFRLGYVVVPSDFADAFAKARAVVDRHASLIEQMVLSEFMHRGLLVAHIRRMRTLYRARQLQLMEGLNTLFETTLPFAAPETGMHLVVPLQRDADDRRIAHLAATAGVVIRPLSPYYSGPVREQGLLLGFSAFDTAEIGIGLHRLGVLQSEIAPFLAPFGGS